MPHDINLIATFAVGFGLALVLGIVAAKLRLPPIIGYLLAGVAIGPHTPGFVADVGLAAQLAEIGVMLLMFGVGLHFSIDDLLSVKRIAVPGAIVQIGTATALGALLAQHWGYPIGGSLVFGLCLSVASTVVLLRALEANGQLDSGNGRIAIGWLVVEDLVMVLALVLLPALTTAFALAGTNGAHNAASTANQAAPIGAIATALSFTLLKVAAFVAFMLIVGKRLFPKLLWWVAKTGSRELFTLAVISTAVAVAFGAAKLFDVSFALGAFFAGMMLRESEFSHRAADESLPLRDAFAVLFFVSVGMLFDPQVIWTEPLKLLAVVGIIVVGKTLAAIALVIAFRYPLSTALTVGASLAQIGEFSFILAALGVSLGLLPTEGQSLILAGAMISIVVNAGLFAMLEPTQKWLETRSSLARTLALREDPLAQLPMSTDPALLASPVVIVGHGRIGRSISALLEAKRIPFVVADQNREEIDALRARGQLAVAGDAAEPGVLIQAHVARATALIVTLKKSDSVNAMIETARTLNPSIRVIVYAANDEEAELLATTAEVETRTPTAAIAESIVASLTRTTAENS